MLWVVIGVLLVLVGLLCWPLRTPVTSKLGADGDSTPAPAAAHSGAARKDRAILNGAPRNEREPIDTNATTWREQSQEEIVATRKLVAEANNVVVNFWGQVVDQDDQPLPGVRVIMSVRKWHFALVGGFDSTFPEFVAQTDGNGRFELRNGRGDNLSIKALTKEGYEAEPGALRSWGYNGAEVLVPDPAAPVVLKMWKADIREKLIEGLKFIRLQLDGRAYTVDFVKGTCAEGEGEGDVRFSMRRSPDAALAEMSDRVFEMIVINGGWVEETDARSPMYAAPENGYVARFESHAKFLDERGPDPFSKRFYLRSRDGKLHGRVRLAVLGRTFGANEGEIRLEYAVNPSGSRVLR